MKQHNADKKLAQRIQQFEKPDSKTNTEHMKKPGSHKRD